ncbi:hypothetical protein ACTWPB_25730 [Nocardia sp. IBHARD005]|uniref:hypothetical protein n=1 Tax=Nocardia sp. IBHARD005 TaxID=3457765 RepID=UPI004058C894
MSISTIAPPPAAVGGGRAQAALPPVLVAGVAVAATAATAAAAADVGGGLRLVLVLVLMSAAPGIPLVALLRLPSRAISVMLGVSTSWAVWLLTSLWQVTAGWWAPTAVAVAVSAVSVAAAARYSRDDRARSRDNDRSVPAVIPARWRPRWWDRWRSVAVLSVVTATLLGWWETRVIDLDATGPYGLIAVVSWRLLLALALVGLAFGLAVGRRRLDQPVAASALAVLVCLLYQLVGVADGSPVVGTGFVHVGFIDYIGTAHRLPPSLDARFSWSGFFDAAAVLVQLAGLPDAVPLLLWAPAVLTAFAALPVFTIATLITGGRRLAWVAMAIFVCGNWFQQDYFSPQAIAFVMHCSIVATLLWLLRSAPLPPLEGTLVQRVSAMVVRVPGLPGSIGRRQVLLLELLLFGIATATVVSHQLTPVLTIISLTLLAGVGSLRQRALPVAVGIVFLTWLSYGAPDYWTGHLHVILGDFGKVSDSLQSGLGDRFSGAEQYQRMQLVRIAWSGSLAVLAGLGWLLYRRRRTALAVAALLAAPFALIAGQSYGGEVVLRCFFYALPIMAPLAALLLSRFYRWVRPLALRRGAAVVALAVAVWVAAVLGVTTRGLNTAFERNPADLVDAARSLLDSVPDRVRLLPSNGEGVVKMSRLTTVVWPEGKQCSVWTVECVDAFDADYILLSTSQQSALELQWGAPHGWLYDFGDQLVAQGRYHVVERTSHALVLARTGRS